MTRFAPTRIAPAAMLALTLLAAPTRAENLAGQSLGGACRDVRRITIALAGEVLSLPREALRAVQGQNLRLDDPRQGCPQTPAPVDRMEIGGPGQPILISPTLPGGDVERAIAYLTKLRGSAACAAPDRIVCTVPETHNGRKFTVRYMFSPDPKQVMSDGAPAHARCIIDDKAQMCLVDMNDPRGFHATMVYPLKTFTPAQVMSVAAGVQERLKEITGRVVDPASLRNVYAFPAPGSRPLPATWLDRRNCPADQISVTLADRPYTIARARLLMITTRQTEPASDDLGCPRAPVPVSALLIHDASGMITVEAGAPPRDPVPVGPCKAGPGMSLCPLTPAAGERAATLYRADGGQAALVCRTSTGEDAPHCDALVARAGLIAQRPTSVPADGNAILAADTSLRAVLDGFAQAMR